MDEHCSVVFIGSVATLSLNITSNTLPYNWVVIDVLAIVNTFFTDDVPFLLKQDHLCFMFFSNWISRGIFRKSAVIYFTDPVFHWYVSAHLNIYKKWYHLFCLKVFFFLSKLLSSLFLICILSIFISLAHWHLWNQD